MKIKYKCTFFMPYRLLVMINQGGERICTGLAEKGQAYPFKFPLSLYQKFEIQRRNYHSKSSHALFKKTGDNHIFILPVFYRQLTLAIWKTKYFKCKFKYGVDCLCFLPYMIFWHIACIASAGFPEEARCFAPLFPKNRLFSL